MKTTKTRLAFLALAMLAAAGCEVDELDPLSSLTLVALSDLADPKGLAGIEVVVQSFGGSSVDRFAAADLADTAAGRPGLGFSGTYPEKVAVDVRLAQDGRTVAQGRVEWKIEQLSRWFLLIERSLYPSGDPVDLESPQCPTSGGPPSGECRGIWRFPVAEDVAKVEDEALWLVLWEEPFP